MNSNKIAWHHDVPVIFAMKFSTAMILKALPDPTLAWSEADCRLDSLELLPGPFERADRLFALRHRGTLSAMVANMRG